MTPLLHRTRPAFEPAVAVVFLALCAVAEVGRHPLSDATVVWWAALVLLAGSIALSHRLPAVALGLAFCCVIAQLVTPGSAFPSWFYLAMLAPAFWIAARSSGRLLVAGAAGTALLALLAAGQASAASPYDIFWMAAVIFLSSFGAAWSAGFALQTWRRRRRAEDETADVAAQRDAAELQIVVAEERERIAQEVHDVMAHSLAVIAAQADGARFLAEQRPEAVVGSLQTISESARDSLRDVRQLIENLVSEPEGHSLPGRADLDALIDRMRAAGLAVEVQSFGELPALSPLQDLAVYRIVQESLTNALRHAGPGARAKVALDGRGPGLAITVASSGDEAPAAAAAGRGIHGMRERARLAGGWLDAGADDAGDEFVVTGFIPGPAVAAA